MSRTVLAGSPPPVGRRQGAAAALPTFGVGRVI